MLVATGTGSGKTECFLYPVLDHCARVHGQGQTGIKALVIYPMNALASDQARRFAQVIAQTPAFKGLRVGLFIGGRPGKDGRGLMAMTATSVITDRDDAAQRPARHPADQLQDARLSADPAQETGKLWAKNNRRDAALCGGG